MSSVSRRVLFALATSERFERAVRALPGGERVAFRRARRYVAGRERGDAFALACRLAGETITCSIDLFGESVSGAAEADRVAEMYVELARALTEAPPGTFLSLDLSHIGIDEPSVAIRGRLERIAEALPAGARVQIGAEQAERADLILEVVLAVARAGLAVSATAQANLKRTPTDARELAEDLQASAPELIHLDVVDITQQESDVQDVPTLTLGFPGEEPRIRWQGLPAGYEFATVVDAIERVSSGEHGLSERTVESLAALRDDLEILVFATPT